MTPKAPAVVNVYSAKQMAAVKTRVKGLVDSGQLRPHVGAVYPLAQAREAFTAKAAGGIPGRVILQP